MPFPVDGYHPFVHADVVFLSDVFEFVSPSEVIDIAETVPCLYDVVPLSTRSLYYGRSLSERQDVLGEEGIPVWRHPFFRMYSRL